MRVLALTRYGRTGASSRLRFYQYLPDLEAAGIHIQMAPLFSDEYVFNLQAGQRSPFDVLKAYARRTVHLRRTNGFDLLWIEKDAYPWLPPGLEQALLTGTVPYVLDYDDAVFHAYDQHRNPLVRHLLDGKHPALMRQASLVVVGNDYLASFARNVGAARVDLVPTVIDLDRYPKPNFSQTRSDTLPCVGWIGQRATAVFLSPLAPTFQRLALEGHARFAAVGIDAASLGLPMASVHWTEDTEVASISGFDIGIMPLVDEPFERGKCGYKLIQYMACGLPVVASPVGVNCQIVEHGVNGFLAETPSQWERAMRKLLADPSLRQRMGQAGRAKVEREYCLQVTGPRVVRIFKELAQSTKKSV
jgi:glycosyltransferase involved in cell wall biosynthesis